jgi:ribosomal-protein-alanine N-acetyltransferase
MPVAQDIEIRTARLVLRATVRADAARAFAIQSNWNVTCNLRMASFPPDRAQLEAWFAAHHSEWLAGTAYRFAILLDGHMIGLADLDEIENGEGDLGYWLDEAYWRHGFALEAARALLRFGRESVGLTALNSGHAADNPASGRILAKLGFRHIGDAMVSYRSRGTVAGHRRYRLDAFTGA